MRSPRTLAELRADPRIACAYRDEDGWWAELSPGYNFELCISLRGETIKHLCEDLRLVVPCNGDCECCSREAHNG